MSEHPDEKNKNVMLYVEEMTSMHVSSFSATSWQCASHWRKDIVPISTFL